MAVRVPAVPDLRFEELCKRVERTMLDAGVPGVALGVLADGKQDTAGFGVTSVDNPLQVTPETLFQIGSITKTVTATVAMRLVEAGLLDLDAPVRTYLPELRLLDEDVAARVTMRHLLTHTAGWVGDYFDDLGAGDDALTRMVAALAELPQLTPLGEVWSYNNAGFYIAGRVLEVVGGAPYESLVREHVLEPLEMKHAFFFAEDVITHRFAVGHFKDDGEPKVASPWAIGRAAHPAGGLVASVDDLLRYARFHLGDGTTPDGTRLLSREALELMRTPVFDTGGTLADAVGLSWMLRDVGGDRLVSHGGGTKGQITLLTLVPDRDFALAVFTNHSDGGEVTRDATRVALALYLGTDDRDPASLEVPAGELAEYAGKYTAALLDIELRLEDGRLFEHITPKGGFPKKDSPPFPAPPPIPLAFYAEDRVFVPEGPYRGGRGDFLRDADGGIRWYRSGGRVHARVP